MLCSLVLAIFFCGSAEALNQCMKKADEGGQFSSAAGGVYGKCITAETADAPAKLEFLGCVASDEQRPESFQMLPLSSPTLKIGGGTVFECKGKKGSGQDPPVLWHSRDDGQELSGCQGKRFGKSYDVKDGERWDNGRNVFQCELSDGKREFRLKPWGCVRELPDKPADRVPVGTAWTLPGDPPGAIGKEYLKQKDLSCMLSPIDGLVKRVEETYVTRELTYTGCRVSVKGKVRALKDGSLLAMGNRALQCLVAENKRSFDMVPWGCAKTDESWEGEKFIPFGNKKPTDKYWRAQSSIDKKLFFNVACTNDKSANTVSLVPYDCEYHDGKEIKRFPLGCVFVVEAKPLPGSSDGNGIGLGYLCRESENGSMTPLVLKIEKGILVPEPNCK